MRTEQQPKQNRRIIALSFLLCTLLALLSEKLDYPFLYGITFSFTSAFLLIGLRLFGYWAGLLATAAVHTIAAQLLNHSLFDYIGLLEIAVVGLLLRKYRNRLFVCAAAFWLILAAPLTYFTHLGHYTSTGSDLMLVTSIIAINGLLNALLADIALHYLPLPKWSGIVRARRKSSSFRSVMLHFSIVCVILPFLLNIHISSTGSFKEASRHAEQLSANVASMIGRQYMESAFRLDGSNTDVKSVLLKSVIAKHASDLFTIVISDGNANAVAATNENYIGQDNTASKHRMNKSIIISNSLRLIVPIHNELPLHISSWHDGKFRYASPINNTDFMINIDIPINNYQYYLFNKYVTHFIYLITFALLAVLAAYFITLWLGRSLKQLAVSTNNLPARLKQDGAIEWPASNISEIRALTANFKQMANNLVLMFGEAQKNSERLQAQAYMLQQSEEKLHRLAYYDQLTCLPNRLHFAKHIQDMIAMPSADDHKIAIMFADINRFKQVNDTLGHATGDMLLKLAASRFADVGTSFDVFRLGGDEFVFVGTYSDLSEVHASAQLVGKAFAEPFDLEGMPLYLTISIGISVYPLDGEDIDTVISNADIAMYSAKEEGDGCHRFYEPKLATAMTEKMRLENGLYNALQTNQFSLHYQPKMNATTGQLCGIEALIRWLHPELGLVPPDKFIPLAEQAGFILEIDKWVFREACRQNKAWQDAGLQPICVSVNISGRHFFQGNLIEMIASALEDTGLPPEYVSIEITEGVFMRDMEQVIETILYLRKLGIQISMDDFGTGYSTLNQLQRLPISDVKLDRSFIQGITTDEKKSSIVRAIIELVHSMNMRVVAEGVETDDESRFCKELKCDELQGYLFSRPLPAHQFEELLAVSTAAITTNGSTG
ncbi:putative bifunctional diguanylate cyclase/phosphodiesterase [Paenibacillus harenae]|uniref:Diguanylate cyclase (GGDEF)-like protein n=1 Tax=Paenibacillus harenae TaxID=306543 RepID=A0ABT9U4Y3_PAEHA|nr:EAL domain-containing protein [Paenibacillus harenae]MDQ0113504.1 diguanylate cyclase (GGDEF)-like protein [Paenibacillus harenae]